MNITNEVTTSNSRIRELPEFPGAKVEAIATNISIDYKPVNPLSTTIVLGYQDFVTNSDGVPFPFTAPGQTPIYIDLSELISVCEGQVDILRMMEDLKIVADLVHNARYNQLGNLSTLTPQPQP